MTEQSIYNAKAYINVVTNKATMKELQEKADAAEFALCIHSSILYGLIEGDPNSVNVPKCYKIIKEAERFGIKPEYKLNNLSK